MSHMLRITSYNTNYDGQGFFPIHHHSTQQGNPNFKLHSIEIPCAMTLTAWQPDSLIDSFFFPKVPRRRQRMGCPTIRRHKDSCTSLKKFSKLRIEVEQRAKDKLQNPTIFEDQHLVRHLTPGFNLLDPDRWKSAKIQVCTRRQASLDQCPVRNHRDLNVTKSWIESRPGASNERGLLDVSSPPRRGLKVANHDVVLGFVQPWLCPCKTLRASQNQGSRNCRNQEKNLRRKAKWHVSKGSAASTGRKKPDASRPKCKLRQLPPMPPSWNCCVTT